MQINRDTESLRSEIRQVGPKVSVIIPCFNQGQYLIESVSSALDSYSGDLEIIVVNDGSTAGRTEDYLEAARILSPTVKIISQANKGLSGARNTGIKAATGEFVQFLDADDVLVPPKLDLQVAHFKLTAGLDISISNFLLCDEARLSFTKHDEAIAHSPLELRDFLYKWERGLSIPIHCALFRRGLLTDRSFDSAVQAKEDWVFWCSLSARGARMRYLNVHNAIYRQHRASMRRSYVKMGANWLLAARKINETVAHVEPKFLDSAQEWFERYYRSHPSYREEIAEGPVSNGSENRIGEDSSWSNKMTVKSIGILRKFPSVVADLPIVSVVIPIFNHYDYLAQCLESVAEQADKVALEIICIDDCSTDQRTIALLQSIQDKRKDLTVVFHRKNAGISATQNEAVELARAPLIAFVDCDDVLPHGALEQVILEMARRPEVDYLFTDRVDVDEEGKSLGRANYGGYPTLLFTKPENIRNDLLDGMVASHLKVIRREAYISHGGSDDTYSGIQDWHLALKIAEDGTFFYLQMPLYHHRIHTGSVTRSDAVAQFRKTNILRRSFARRWLGEPGEVKQWITYKGSDKALPRVVDLKQAWRQGLRCEFVFDRPGAAPEPILHFLREFNSYFDRIEWSDPRVYAALIGYTWGGILVKKKVIRRS